MRFGIRGPTQVRGGDGRDVGVGGPGVRAPVARLLIDPWDVLGTGRLIDDLYGARAAGRCRERAAVAGFPGYARRCLDQRRGPTWPMPRSPPPRRPGWRMRG